MVYEVMLLLDSLICRRLTRPAVYPKADSAKDVGLACMLVG